MQEEIKTLSRHLSELTTHKRLHLEKASTRLRFPALVARSAGPAFAAVLSSTLRRKQLCFGYHSRGSDEHTDRVVSPQRVVHYREAWYMDAWDEVKEELRSVKRKSCGGYLLEASMDRRIWRRTRVQNSLRALVAGEQK